MNELVRFFTDAATMAVFDPQVLEHHIGDEEGWRLDITTFPGVSTGDITVVDLGGDGVYDVRVTDEELTTDERAYATELGGEG